MEITPKKWNEIKENLELLISFAKNIAEDINCFLYYNIQTGMYEIREKDCEDDDKFEATDGRDCVEYFAGNKSFIGKVLYLCDTHCLVQKLNNDNEVTNEYCLLEIKDRVCYQITKERTYEKALKRYYEYCH